MKRALLIGINYTGSEWPLNGCINDITNINNLLTKQCNYQSGNVRILTDAPTNNNKPTKKNIEDGIRWLASNCKAGDTLFFYYSGHGSQITDSSKDEKLDGKDEVLVPLDYKENYVITDDWLYANMVNVLPQGVTLWAFTDCCHSGTMLDLNYNIRCDSTYRKGQVTKNLQYNGNDWTNQFGFYNELTKENNANVYLFTGCLDPQTSADAFIQNQSQGAFTACFLDFIKNNSTKRPDGTLIFNSNTRKLTEMLKEINCRLIINGFVQRSQLSMAKIKDINALFNP
jgi:hypothetical protein